MNTRATEVLVDGGTAMLKAKGKRRKPSLTGTSHVGN
jgi:hypothetical protein